MACYCFASGLVICVFDCSISGPSMSSMFLNTSLFSSAISVMVYSVKETICEFRPALCSMSFCALFENFFPSFEPIFCPKDLKRVFFFFSWPGK